MRCSEFRDVMSALADGELVGGQLSDALAHADTCDECRRAYTNMCALQDSISCALSECDDMPDMVSAVNMRILPKRHFFALPHVWAVAATVALLAIGGFAVVRTNKSEVNVVISPAPTRSAPRMSAPVEPDRHACRKGKDAEPTEAIERKSRPRLVAAIVKARKPKPVSVKRMADDAQRSALMSVEAAEFTVEYTDAAPYQSVISLNTVEPVELVQPVPDNRMRGPVIAVSKIVSRNGVRTDQLHYMNVQPKSDENYRTDNVRKEPS